LHERRCASILDAWPVSICAWRAPTASTLKTSQSKPIRSLLVQLKLGERACEKPRPFVKQFENPKVERQRDGNPDRIGIDTSLFGSRVAPATSSEVALAGRGCAGRTGIKSISTVECLNRNLVTTLPDTISRAMMLRSSSRPRPPPAPQKCIASVADTAMPTVANACPLFRKKLADRQFD